MENNNERPMTVYEYVAYKRNRSQYLKEVSDQLDSAIESSIGEDHFYLNNVRLTKKDLDNLLKSKGLNVETEFHNSCPLYANQYIVKKK